VPGVTRKLSPPGPPAPSSPSVLEADPVRTFEGDAGLGAVLKDPVQPRERDSAPAPVEFLQQFATTDRRRGRLQDRDDRPDHPRRNPR
jgi:hypothetical protein